MNPARPHSPRNSTIPGTSALRLSSGWRSSLAKVAARAASVSVSRAKSASTPAAEREHRRDDPDGVVVRGVEHHFADDGTERQAAVHRDRPVRDRFSAPFDRREIGDHRAGTDEERRLTQAAQHSHHDEDAEVRRQRVERRGHRDDERTEDHQDPAAVAIPEPPGVRAQHHRTDREGADRDPDPQRVTAELALHVLRQHREDHAERQEVQRAGRRDREELRRQESRALLRHRGMVALSPTRPRRIRAPPRTTRARRPSAGTA